MAVASFCLTARTTAGMTALKPRLCPPLRLRWAAQTCAEVLAFGSSIEALPDSTRAEASDGRGLGGWAGGRSAARHASSVFGSVRGMPRRARPGFWAWSSSHAGANPRWLSPVHPRPCRGLALGTFLPSPQRPARNPIRPCPKLVCIRARRVHDREGEYDPGFRRGDKFRGENRRDSRRHVWRGGARPRECRRRSCAPPPEWSGKRMCG